MMTLAQLQTIIRNLDVQMSPMTQFKNLFLALSVGAALAQTQLPTNASSGLQIFLDFDG